LVRQSISILMVLKKVSTIALVPSFDEAGCTISFSQHQYDDAVLGQFGLVIDGTVLVIAVKMVDQALWRAANNTGLRSATRAKSPCRRLPVAQLTTRRANRSMTTARYSQPPRRDVGDIHTTFLIRACGSKILIDDIAGDWPMMIAVRCALKPPLLPCMHAIFTHQPCRSLATDGEAIVSKFPRHVRVTSTAFSTALRTTGTVGCSAYHAPGIKYHSPGAAALARQQYPHCRPHLVCRLRDHGAT
jgi:hypothetical protein